MADEGDHDLLAAESLRWAISRLSSRLRAQQTGSDESLSRLATSVLANLHHSGPLAAATLASIEGLQPQSLTRVIKSLEAGGYISKSADERDGRRQAISITATGEAALQGHVRGGNAWLAAALRHELTDSEVGIIRVAAALLQQVAETDLDQSHPSHPSITGELGAAPHL